MFTPSGWIPAEIKSRVYNAVVEALARFTERTPLDKQGADVIRNLSTDAEFRNEFETALSKAVQRFHEEYVPIDPDVVRAMEQNPIFWQEPAVLRALQSVIKRPGSLLRNNKEEVVKHFANVLPGIEKDRVDRAVTFLLTCLADELWDLPVLRPVYQLVFARATVDKVSEMVFQLKNLREESKQSIAALVQSIAESRQLEAGTGPLMLTSASTKVKHNVPRQSYEFVGRQKDFAEALRVLQPYPTSRYHLLTIDGVGGVGKTALAIELAAYFIQEHRRLPKEERFDALIWTSAKREVLTDSCIASRQPSLRTVSDIYRAVADTLDRPEINNVGDEEQALLVNRALAQTRTLLIVDNLETVDDQRVIQFLRDLPSPTKAVVTTRHRIEGAYPLRLEGISSEDARALITQELTRKVVTLSEKQTETLAEATTGIPLAIVWTIGQLRLGRQLDDALLSLRSAAGNYAEFCFKESVRQINTLKEWPAWKLLLGLSLFASSATREAVGFVAGLQDLAGVRDRGLVILLDLSIINYESGRFSMLSLTKEYALAELSRDLDFKTSATQRWIQWHTKLTERASGGRLDLDASVLDSLKQEYPNILAAIDATFRAEYFDAYVALTRGLEFFWFGAGYWHEFDRCLERGRFFAPAMIDKVHFALRLAWLSIMREDFARAEELIAFSQKLLDDYPNEYERMRLEDFSGQLRVAMNQLDPAENHFNTSLAIARRLGDRRGQFACLKYLGELYCQRGTTDRARQYLIEAEPLAAGTGQDQWVRGLAHSFHLRGIISNREKNWKDAEGNLKTCCDYLRIWPDERLLTRVLVALSEAQAGLDRADEAAVTLTKAGEVLQRLGLKARAGTI
jgi:hypothetical protein